MNPSMVGEDSRGDAGFNPELLLALAKAGDRVALGRLLERYRNYMAVLIRIQVGRRLSRKVDAEDLLQEIGLEVHRKLSTFRGAGAGVPDVGSSDDRLDPGQPGPALPRDQVPRPPPGASAVDELDHSSRALNASLVAPESTPSQQAIRREQAVILSDALQELPEKYREVIILRHLEGLSFPDIARRLDRTEDSVKNVWLRGLARLRRIMEKHR